MVNIPFLRGEPIALRGMIFGKVQFVQSVIVEHDTDVESALLLLPGAECAFPDWYAGKSTGGALHSARWEEALSKKWGLNAARWHTNRFLMITDPSKHYSVYLIWEHATDRFDCYYVNFQLPIRRSHCGYDTYDLELDIVVSPDGGWCYKDEEAFHEGIRLGIIKDKWAEAIDTEKNEVITAIENKDYPFNNHWLGYQVDPSWRPPRLPAGWDVPVKYYQ